MAELTTNTIASTYTMLLKTTAVIDSTLRKVEGGNGTDSALMLADDSIAIDTADKLFFDSGNNTYIHEAAADRLDFVVGGDVDGFVLKLDTTTKVGIGTAAPGANLEVKTSSGGVQMNLNGTTDSTIDFQEGGSTKGQITYDASHDQLIVRANSGKLLRFDTGGTDARMTILSTGLVGIGHATPLALLQVGAINTLVTDGSTAVTPEGMNVHVTEASKYAMGIMNADASGDGLLISAGDAADDYALRVMDYDNAVTLFSVNGLGNVGIRTDTAREELEVSGAIISSQGHYVTTYNTDNRIWNSAGSASGSATLYIGNETIDTSASDARMKNIVNETPMGLDSVNDMEVHTFTWKKDEDSEDEVFTHTGMIAQEMDEKYPWLVKKPENEEEIGWAIKYNNLVPVLIKAIQELSAKVTALENA
jgi:hypothetical protein